MNKKKLLIIIGIVVVILSGVIYLIHYGSYKKNITGEYINLVNNYNSLILDYFDRHSYIDSGYIDVTAKFKGAHGESYPSEYKYSFSKKDDVINIYNDIPTFVDVNNDLSYVEIKSNDKLLKLINLLKSINIMDIKLKDIDGNRISFDEDEFNKVFNTNVKSVYALVNTSGYISKVDSVDIYIDDNHINIKGNEYNIDYDENHIKFILNEKGYSLNVNDSLKVNAFLNYNKDVYSVVLNDYVFSLELKDNFINIKASSESAIYNGLDVNINFNNVEHTGDYKLDESDFNPIKRYLDGCNLVYWR